MKVTPAEIASRQQAPVGAPAGAGGRLPSKTSISSSKFYAVARGRTVGIFDTYAECARSVTGFPGAIHRSFSTRTEAQKFIDANNRGGSSFQGGDGGNGASVDAASVGRPVVPPAAAALTASAAAAAGGAAPKAIAALPVARSSTSSAPPSRGAAATATAATPRTVAASRSLVPSFPKQPPASIAPSSFLRVFTDGSCPKNGRGAVTAGVGIFFGPGDSRNRGEPLPGEPKTNQRAEIYAAVRALQILADDEASIGIGPRHAEIVTDSNYLVQAMTDWIFSWSRRGWKKADMQDVMNLDLFLQCVALCQQRFLEGAYVKWTHIAGHAGLYGNTEADELAVQGSQRGLEQLKQNG